jgi:hypothetical protein
MKILIQPDVAEAVSRPRALLREKDCAARLSSSCHVGELQCDYGSNR